MEIVEHEFLARLRTFVRRRVPSSADADDVIQTVLLRLLESRDGPTPASTPAWLLATARRAITDLYRSRRPEASPDEGGPVDAPAQDGEDITRCLLPILDALADDDRLLLQRVDIDGESQSDIARALNLTSSGLKSRVQRARARLRAALLARCIVERDARGLPTGPAQCKSDCGSDPCRARDDDGLDPEAT